MRARADAAAPRARAVLHLPPELGALLGHEAARVALLAGVEPSLLGERKVTPYVTPYVTPTSPPGPPAA